MRAMIVVIVLILTGCSLAPSDKVLKALVASDRSWCFSAVTIYGRGAFGGSGVHSGSMTCNLDGLALKSEAATVGVPMQVVPQVTIGAPTLRQAPPAAPPPAVVPSLPAPRPRQPLGWLRGPERFLAVLDGLDP